MDFQLEDDLFSETLMNSRHCDLDPEMFVGSEEEEEDCEPRWIKSEACRVAQVRVAIAYF